MNQPTELIAQESSNLAWKDCPDTAEKSIRSFVEDAVRRTPKAKAAIFGGESISYEELELRANRLAHHLITLGVETERLVGVCLPRSIEMVVTLVAIFKAGGGYVFFDPDYPAERLAFMLEDCGPVAIVTHSSVADKLPPTTARVVHLDKDQKSIDVQSATPPTRKGGREHLAYIIYTSGSTGTAKAIAMPQGVLCNLLEWQLLSWSFPAAARTLQFTSLNFDVAFQEIFSTLAAGGTLVLTTEAERHDPARLLQVMRDFEVERLFLPFVWLQQLAKTFEIKRIPLEKLRDVITAGEQLQITPQLKEFFSNLKSARLHNQYGPAESHVVTAHVLVGDPAKWPLLPPIGKPVAKARIYILDGHGKPVPAGATGEIYIGGDTLARGYLNREELTAARFVHDPFAGDPDARMYQTGDLGSFLPDGEIQFLGRLDQQVKIRGVRVELGEVEAILSEHPLVEHAVAVASEIAAGEKRLIAYYVPTPSAPPPRPCELREFLTARLPPHFVPSAFVRLDAIPFTPTGKLNRLALPPPASQRDDELIVPADTPLQSEIVTIWERLLNVRPIGIRDDFFDLGGDSLLAVQIAAEISQITQKNVPIAWTFAAATIEALAGQLVEVLPPAEVNSVVGIHTKGKLPAFFCICGFFDLARHLGTNQPFYQLGWHRLAEITDPSEAFHRLGEQALAEIRAEQPSGPYRLGGHSLGAVIAFDVALRLQELGEKVEVLVLLEPDLPKPVGWSHLRRAFGLASRYLRRMGRLTLGEQWRALLTSSRWHSAVFSAKRKAAGRFGEMTVDEKLQALEGSYAASTFKGRVIVFVAGDADTNPLFEPRLDWGRFATEGAVVYTVPGGHETFAREPNVRVLANILRKELLNTSPRSEGTIRTPSSCSNG